MSVQGSWCKIYILHFTCKLTFFARGRAPTPAAAPPPTPHWPLRTTHGHAAHAPPRFRLEPRVRALAEPFIIYVMTYKLFTESTGAGVTVLLQLYSTYSGSTQRRVREFTVKRPNHFTVYTRSKFYSKHVITLRPHSGQIFVTAPCLVQPTQVTGDTVPQLKACSLQLSHTYMYTICI